MRSSSTLFLVLTAIALARAAPSHVPGHIDNTPSAKEGSAKQVDNRTLTAAVRAWNSRVAANGKRGAREPDFNILDVRQIPPQPESNPPRRRVAEIDETSNSGDDESVDMKRRDDGDDADDASPDLAAGDADSDPVNDASDSAADSVDPSVNDKDNATSPVDGSADASASGDSAPSDDVTLSSRNFRLRPTRDEVDGNGPSPDEMFSDDAGDSDGASFAPSDSVSFDARKFQQRENADDSSATDDLPDASSDPSAQDASSNDISDTSEPSNSISLARRDNDDGLEDCDDDIDSDSKKRAGRHYEPMLPRGPEASPPMSRHANDDLE